jgi:hypothetical protein
MAAGAVAGGGVPFETRLRSRQKHGSSNAQGVAQGQPPRDVHPRAALDGLAPFTLARRELEGGAVGREVPDEGAGGAEGGAAQGRHDPRCFLGCDRRAQGRRELLKACGALHRLGCFGGGSLGALPGAALGLEELGVLDGKTGLTRQLQRQVELVAPIAPARLGTHERHGRQHAGSRRDGYDHGGLHTHGAQQLHPPRVHSRAHEVPVTDVLEQLGRAAAKHPGDGVGLVGPHRMVDVQVLGALGRRPLGIDAAYGVDEAVGFGPVDDTRVRQRRDGQPRQTLEDGLGVERALKYGPRFPQQTGRFVPGLQ